QPSTATGNNARDFRGNTRSPAAKNWRYRSVAPRRQTDARHREAVTGRPPEVESTLGQPRSTDERRAARHKQREMPPSLKRYERILRRIGSQASGRSGP